MKDISEVSKGDADNSTLRPLRRCKSLDLSKQPVQQNQDNPNGNHLQEGLNNVDKAIIQLLAQQQKEIDRLRKKLSQGVVTENGKIENGTVTDKYKTQDTKHELNGINEKINKMNKIGYYKKLENKYREEIDKLYKEGARPDDIIITKDGFGVKDRALDKLEDTRIIKYINNIDFINKRLANFHGDSIKNIVKKGSTKDLNALTDLTVYYLTQSKEKAFTVSSDEQLVKIWNQVREIYERQAKFRDNTKEAIDLIRYTERYSELKHFPAKKKASQESAKRKFKQLDSYLSYSLMPSHRSRLLKQKMVKTLEQEEARKQHLEKKYGSHKSGILKDAANGQEIKLKGSRGKEQRKLALIIELRKELQRISDSIKLEEVKGKLIHEKFTYDVNNFLEKYTDNPLLNKETRKQVDQARGAFMYYSNNAAIRNGFSDMNGKLKFLQKNLEELEERLQKSIKKYGSNQLRSWLNDIASDGGFIVTVTGTAVSWLHTVPFAAV